MNTRNHTSASANLYLADALPGATPENRGPGSPVLVPLYRLAHGRTGDKGNRSNISVIAWRFEFFPLLVEQLTEAVVSRHFAHRRPTRVQRYALPGLHALNFVLDDVLDGGVNDALNLDTHGKGLAYWLLDLSVPVPVELLPLLAGTRPTDPLPSPVIR